MKKYFKLFVSYLLDSLKNSKKQEYQILELTKKNALMCREIENLRTFTELQGTINSQYQELFTTVVKTMADQNDAIENFNYALNELVAGYYDEDPIMDTASEEKIFSVSISNKDKNKGKLN